MMTTKKILSFITAGICSCSLAVAGEILYPAAQIEKGKGAVILFYSDIPEKVSFQVSHTDQITVSGHSYFSTASNDIQSDARSKSIGLKAIFNPWEGLTYWFTFGTGSYAIDIPSATVKNSISGTQNGARVAGGFRARIFPETIVTPALALDFGLWHSRYTLDRFQTGGATYAVSDQLDTTQVQAAMLISKNYTIFEPYGGLKVFKTFIALRDAASLSEASGSKDGAGIIAGVRWHALPHESLVIEGSYTGETDFTIGWNIDF